MTVARNCRHLKKIRLSGRSLPTDALVAALSHATNLEDLSLHELTDELAHKLVGTLPKLVTLATTELSEFGVGMTDDGLNALVQGRTHLRHLTLTCCNNFTLDGLACLRNLETLELESNGVIYGTDLLKLLPTNHPSLQSLHLLHWPNLTVDFVLDILAKCPTLTELVVCNSESDGYEIGGEGTLELTQKLVKALYPRITHSYFWLR